MTWRTVQRDDAERFGSAEVRVLHPARPEWERQRVRNEDSIVIEVRVGAVSIVLPGDIGREAERAILPTLEPGRLTILKAPHHGSATSSTKEFLETTRPAAVIFSCGRENRFGHPASRGGRALSGDRRGDLLDRAGRRGVRGDRWHDGGGSGVEGEAGGVHCGTTALIVLLRDAQHARHTSTARRHTSNTYCLRRPTKGTTARRRRNRSLVEIENGSAAETDSRGSRCCPT